MPDTTTPKLCTQAFVFYPKNDDYICHPAFSRNISVADLHIALVDVELYQKKFIKVFYVHG